MPWELLIRGRDGGPLGSRDAVAVRVAAACGGSPLAPPPLPPPEALAAMPEASRAAFLAPTLRAVHAEAGLSFELWCGDAPVVSALHADVRGVGDPLPFLRRLCGPGGWVVYDAADYFKAPSTPASAAVDLAAAPPPRWAEFCGWRDRVIGELLGSPGSGSPDAEPDAAPRTTCTANPPIVD